jgi:hypothetical protein
VFDLLSEFDATPDAGAVISGELVVTDDVPVKAFALGPDAGFEPHAHDGAHNETDDVAVLTASRCPLPGQ